jgi:hypothetical protein
MEHSERSAGALRLGSRAAIITAAGILISGPIGLYVVAAVQPSPPWVDAATYAAAYHPIQTLPFFAGFFMVTGFAAIMAALYQLAAERLKAVVTLAVVMTAAFCTLIFFNYVNQTTFVPAMVQSYRPESAPIITALAMANPRSLAWALEMWGYGFLGLATWLAAPVFGGSGLERVTAGLMVFNGVISVLGALATAYDVGWVLTSPGIASFALWNLVVFALAVCVWLVFRRRLASGPHPT